MYIILSLTLIFFKCNTNFFDQCFFLTEHNVAKAYWGVDVLLHAFFDLGTR